MLHVAVASATRAPRSRRCRRPSLGAKRLSYRLPSDMHGACQPAHARNGQRARRRTRHRLLIFCAVCLFFALWPALDAAQALGQMTATSVAGVAQSVRAPGCGPGGRRFKSGRSPHPSSDEVHPDALAPRRSRPGDTSSKRSCPTHVPLFRAPSQPPCSIRDRPGSATGTRIPEPWLLGAAAVGWHACCSPGARVNGPAGTVSCSRGNAPR